VDTEKRRFAEDLLGDHPHIASGLPGRLRLPALPQLRRVVCLDLDEGFGGMEVWGDLLVQARDVPDALLDAVAAEVEPSDDALIIYTSGTTSQPKASCTRSARRAPGPPLRRHAALHTRGPDLHHISILLDGGDRDVDRRHIRGRRAPARAADLRARRRARHDRARARHGDHAWPISRSNRRAPSAAPGATSERREDRRALADRGRSRASRRTSTTTGRLRLSETFTICSATPADAPAEERRANSGRSMPGMELRIVDPTTGLRSAWASRGRSTVRA